MKTEVRGQTGTLGMFTVGLGSLAVGLGSLAIGGAVTYKMTRVRFRERIIKHYTQKHREVYS